MSFLRMTLKKSAMSSTKQRKALRWATREGGYMKAYNIIFLLGSILTLIGTALLVLVDRLERGGPGLLILLLGMVIATYGLVLRVFSQVFKKNGMYAQVC